MIKHIEMERNLVYLLAIDQGTSSTRAILYNAQGQSVKSHQIPIETQYPHPGWVEQNPEIIWQNTLKAIQSVTHNIPIKKIIACGITNQRETTVLWHKQTGACIGPAIVWQDRRTVSLCQEKAALFDEIRQKTGLRLDAYFSASKIEWLINHYPQAKTLANQGLLAFGTIDSFLLWRLTKGQAHKTDITNASRTLLFDIHQKQWDHSLLNAFHIPESILPTVESSDSLFGTIHADWLGINIPITGIAGDQQAALIGQACLKPGMIKATFGTGGFLLLNTGKQIVNSKHQLLTTIAYQIQGQTCYGLEGSIYQAGAIIRWLVENLGILSTPAESSLLANTLSSNEGVYLIPAFTGLGAPHWYPHPGGAIFGLTRATQRAHIARAALESIAYQAREVLTCMKEDSQLTPSVLRVDGGVSTNPWFLNYLSHQTQLTIQSPVDIELTARGAAMLAGIGIGLIDPLSTLETLWQEKSEIQAPTATAEAEQDYQGWKMALNTLLGAHSK